jgi:hypothetical protein
MRNCSLLLVLFMLPADAPHPWTLKAASGAAASVGQQQQQHFTAQVCH